MLSCLNKKEFLTRIKNNGFYPEFIIDCGFGMETKGLFENFPNSKKVIIEPIVEAIPFMEDFCKNNSNSKFYNIALSDFIGDIEITYRPGITGSSIHRGEITNSEKRKVETSTLDQMIKVNDLKGLGLLKLDVEGHEWRVLQGAKNSLNIFEVIIIEISMWPKENEPDVKTFFEYSDFFYQNNYVLYDILELGYRKIDIALQQFDAVFIKKDSILRKTKKMKTKKQGEDSLNHKYNKYLNKLKNLGL